jgi:hypothetical protein
VTYGIAEAMPRYKAFPGYIPVSRPMHISGGIHLFAGYIAIS